MNKKINLFFDRGRAETVLNENKGDLVAFGRPFISIPDLVYSLQNGLPLTEPGENTFYTSGSEGYLDYSDLEK